jgi:aryl carrier-like protein
VTLSRDAAAEYVAPTTAEQALMTGIWAKVLGVPRVGVTDSFFDLGGDSRRALELIVAAARLGVTIDLRELLARQTIAALTSVSGTSGAYLVDSFRAMELTPVQREIHRRRAATGCWEPRPHPISVASSVSPERLEIALTLLAGRHEILQGRLDEGTGRPQLRFLDHGPGVPLLLAGQEHVPAAISEMGQRPPGERAPVSALWLGDEGASPTALLLFDDVLLDVRSRDLLVADLERCYLAAGGVVEDAWPVPAPFSAWARQFPERAADVSEEETAYWLSHGDQGPEGPGRAAPDDGRTEVYTTRLPQHLTESLLRELPQKWRIDPAEVLATALATALRAAGVAGPMDIEADGRPWHRGDVRFDESAGQCGVAFPVCPALDPSWPPRRRLAAMQDQLRGVPSYGTGASLLREFSPDPAVRAALVERPGARIVFRTAGLTVPRVAGRLISSAGSDAMVTRTYPVEVVPVREPACLRIDWAFAEGEDRTTVRQLAELTAAAVGPLIDVVLRAPVGSFPTDYPLSRLAARGRVRGGRAEQRR